MNAETNNNEHWTPKEEKFEETNNRKKTVWDNNLYILYRQWKGRERERGKEILVFGCLFLYEMNISKNVAWWGQCLVFVSDSIESSESFIASMPLPGIDRSISFSFYWTVPLSLFGFDLNSFYFIFLLCDRNLSLSLLVPCARLY